MKKIVALLILALLILSLPLTAFADSSIVVNGNEVSVSSIITNGATLVPMEFMKEVFGSEFIVALTDGKITMNFRNITVIMNTDSDTALVNDMPVALEASPVKFQNTALIPLRFSVENFGGSVQYDATTKKINVDDRKNADSRIKDFSNLLKYTEQEYIGDSYYNWSMQYSKDWAISSRPFDGKSLILYSDTNDAQIIIKLTENKNHDNINVAYEMQKIAIGDYPLIKQVKRITSTGVNYTEAMYHSYTNTIVDSRVYVTDNYLYSLNLSVDEKATKTTLQRYLSLADTFNVIFAPNKTQDLNDVDSTGYKTFEDTIRGIKLKVPQQWDSASDSSYSSGPDSNSIAFSYVDEITGNISGEIDINLYNINSVGALSDYVRRKRDLQNDIYNSDFVAVSDMIPTKISQYDALMFTETFFNKKDTINAKYIFIPHDSSLIEIKTYFSQKSFGDSDAESKILSSVELGTPNLDKITLYSVHEGTDNSVTRTVTDYVYNYQYSIPVSFIRTPSNYYSHFSTPIYQQSDTGMIISVDCTDAGDATVDDVMYDSYSKVVSADSVSVIAEMMPKNLKNTVNYYSYKTKSTSDSAFDTINKVYTFAIGQKVFTVTAKLSENYNGSLANSLCEQVVNSIVSTSDTIDQDVNSGSHYSYDYPDSIYSVP